MEDKYKIVKKKRLDRSSIESHMDFEAILTSSNPTVREIGTKTKIIPLIATAVVTTAAAGLLLFFFHNTTDDLEYITNQQSAIAQLETPFEGHDIAYEEHEFETTDKEDTIYFSSGSSAIIPKEAFVDENGKPITGKVALSYRELNTNQEMIVAGVLKESSENTHFQSAGMIEIKGSKNGKPIYFNEGHEIQIQLHSVLDHDFVDDNFLSYHFEDGNWNKNGADQIQKVALSENNTEFEEILQQIRENEIASKPVEPIQPGDVPSSYQLFDFDVNRSDYSALSSLQDDVEFLVKKSDLEKDPFSEEWNQIDIRSEKENEFVIELSQIDDKGLISKTQYLTIYPYRAYSIAAQKTYEKNYASYVTNQQRWENKIQDLATAMFSEQVMEDQIVNHFSIDRFGLWNCAKEISPESMNDQIEAYMLSGQVFEPTRVYVFNNQTSFYMSKESDLFSNHYRLADEHTRIMAMDEQGAMFLCDQKKTESGGYLLNFIPMDGTNQEELDRAFGITG